MGFKLLLVVLLLEVVAAKITLDVNIDENQEVSVLYNGTETHLITDDDIISFNITNENLLAALNRTLGRRPKNVYLRGPIPPFGDFWKNNYEYWAPIKRVLKIKSARFKRLEKHPDTELSQKFENPSRYITKVNTGSSRTLENTLTTSWSGESNLTVFQGLEYETNVGIANVGGKISFSYTTTAGDNEEISRTENSTVKVELKPGVTMTTVTRGISGYLEMEVVHAVSLTGDMAALDPFYDGTAYYKIAIEQVSTYEGIKDEFTTTETIGINFNIETQLQVYN